jgi:hypothetical protein
VESGSKRGGVFDGGGSGSQGEAAAVTGEYKLKVLRKAEQCEQPGEIGGLLRREGLYWSNLSTWRKQRERGELAPGYQLTSAVLASGRKTP